jgi:hypothetical protein
MVNNRYGQVNLSHELSTICRGVYPRQKIEKTGIGGRKTVGKKMSVFTINFLTYQPGGLGPMEFLQVPPGIYKSPHIKTILSKV